MSLNCVPTADVSIITRTKDRPLLLKRAIEDVLNQTYQNWVHVIVNDGGCQTPVDMLLDEYKTQYNSRAHIIHNLTSRGMEAASNRGINESDSKYIVIHDDDDTWHPEFLSKCIAFLDNENHYLLKDQQYAGVVTHSTRILESIDDAKVKFVDKDSFNDWMKNISLSRLLCSNTFPPISFVFKRSLIREVGCFREDLPVLGDWDFHLRTALRHEIGLIQEPLANYHHRLPNRNDSYSNTVVDANDKHRHYENLYRNQLLRDDISNGRFGLGVMLVLCLYLETLTSVVFSLKSIADKIFNNRAIRNLKPKLKKVFNR